MDKYIKEGLGFPVTLKFWQDFLPYLQLLKALTPSPLGALLVTLCVLFLDRILPAMPGSAQGCRCWSCSATRIRCRCPPLEAINPPLHTPECTLRLRPCDPNTPT